MGEHEQQRSGKGDTDFQRADHVRRAFSELTRSREDEVEVAGAQAISAMAPLTKPCDGSRGDRIMRHRPLLAALAMGAALTACAHAPETVLAPPDYSPIAGDPAPAHARLYADCIGQAAATGVYRRAADGGGDELILFTCTGAPARAFWDALGPWSVSIGSGFDHDGRSYRATAKVQANMFGVDSCSTANNADHRCTLTFNAGDFLNGE
jgi:hypothetical protein